MTGPNPQGTPEGTTVPAPPYASSYGGPMMFRPPRNPRQNAAVAAGVLIIIAGISALIFANLILFWDAFSTGWDEDTGDKVLGFEGGPFMAGVLLLLAFSTSFISTYSCFRHDRFTMAIAGPIAMVVAYFSMSMDDWMILAVGAHMFVLSVVAIYLLYFSRSIFGTEGGMEDPSRLSKDGGALPPTSRGIGPIKGDTMRPKE